MHPVPPLTKRLARVAAYFKSPWQAWVATVASTIVISLSEPLVPALLKPLLDQGFNGQGIPLWSVPVALMGIFGVRGFSAFLGQIALAKVANQGLLELRLAMFRRLLDAHPKLYREQNASALGNTLVYEVQHGANLMVNSLLSVSRDSLTLLALTGYLIMLNWKLCLIVSLLLPAVAWLMRAATRRLFALSKSNQAATDELAYVVEENALAHREVRLQGAQEDQMQRFDRLSHTLNRIAMKSTVASSALTPTTQMLAATALSVVICLVLYQSNQGGATVGEFAAFITAMLMLVAPIKHLSEVASPITRGLAAIERGLDLIEQTPTETSGHHTCARAVGQLSFEGVCVQYTPDSPAALDGVSLDIRAGQSVAFVGSSGAGKTTLVNLIPRFIDPQAGRVTLDGTELREWDLSSLRRQVAMVSQNVTVLNDTLAHNVALGAEMNRARVMGCLRAAHLEEFVATLELSIDSLVGHNASQLSGGQRQRLAIARALYKDAPILILDEATSALDNESERAVQQALKELQRNRTTLIIAHRLSTIEQADHIVVMDCGRIIETGTHAQLLALGGTYAALYKLGSFTPAEASKA